MAPRIPVPSGPILFEKDPETGKEIQLIDWNELSQHNTSSSCWIAVRGKVYDVTSFLHRHPGGIDTLLYGAGRDSTLVVETYHDLGSLAPILSKFLIGRLVSDELPTFPEPNTFHRTLKERVSNHLRSESKDSKNPGLWVILRYASIYLSVLGSWSLIFLHPWVKQYWVIQSILALVLGFGCALIGLHPLHDASHFAITHNPLVWKLLGATHDFFNGTSYLIWVYQHMLGHHPYTNIPGADPDISTNDPDVRRIQPFQTWYDRYIGQEKYVPFLYGLLAWKTRFQDIYILYVLGMNDSIRINPPTLHHHLAFWGGKLFFVGYRIVLPIYLVGLWRTLLVLILSDLVSSYWLALTFQVNHVVDTVEFIASPQEAACKELSIDWAEMQLLTTQDYAHHSTLWTWITGGLNYQAVHHVFPQVHQAHYPDIAPVVESTCTEYGHKFICQDTFLEAFNGHITHLRALGLKSQD
ncbi:hypothetical protein DSO57_1032699 [Entomophthora muscae]|uniref:Uncharacterized protein n=1 Tax=Entomophthora muscae TaxID=34485 RepID=A0ACC2SPA8_9FUNG|nr:hypothetical protein DSO57_1032699 [Entomophthora muscae]